MRSLWRRIATRWLGGDASEALTGDTVLRDLLSPEPARPSFVVRPASVSHRAMLSQHDEARTQIEPGFAFPREAGSDR